MWEKEKMLVTSIFSFSHNAFKGIYRLGREKVGLCGQELNAAKRAELVCVRVENIVGKGLPAFFSLSYYVLKSFLSQELKVLIVW